MLVETLMVNTLHPRRKHDKNIYSGVRGTENLAEASTCLSGSEATVAGTRATVLTEQQMSAGAECCAALAVPLAAFTPTLPTTSQGASAQSPAALTSATAVASASSSTRGRENEVKNTKIP